MKLTRRQLVRTLSYAGPLLATRTISALMSGKPVMISEVLSATIASPQGAEPAPYPDLVVYGGTASGVMTAYSAAREGLRVVLLEPGARLGGMVTGGLSCTDVGRYSIIGGYVRDFYRKAASHYGLRDLDHMENWYSEPHVSEDIFCSLLRDAGVTVHYHRRLHELNGVELQGKRIISITTGDGRRWPATIFADCTYEGDLMAKAKIGYTWGREAASEYGEILPECAGTHPRTSFSGRFQPMMSTTACFRRSIPGLWPLPVPAIRKCRPITSA